jgi:hypothetical protein
MGFFEDLGNAVCSGLAIVGDAVETIVETVTDTAENAVDAFCNGAEELVTLGTDWVVQNTGGETIMNGGGFAILIGAVLNSIITVVREVVDGGLHIVKGVGKIVGSIFRLDLPGLVQAFLDVLIGIGQIVLIVLRTLTLGVFIGKFVEAVQRNELKSFVENLLTDNFGKADLDLVRKKLAMDSPAWGLTCDGINKVFTIDSRAFPLASLHNSKAIDIFAMAGVLSFDSFSILQSRNRVHYLSDDGGEAWIPATRYHISKFLEGGSPQLKIYAMNGTELRDSLDFASRHFRQACIRFNWSETILFPRQYSPAEFKITNLSDYFLVKDNDAVSILLNTSGLKPDGENNLTIRAQSCFQFVSSGGQLADTRGITSGRHIDEGNVNTGSAGGGGCDITVQAISNDPPNEKAGSGVTRRTVYPGYFSKMVLCHEIGHYFGLCHLNHNGFQNIMFSSNFENYFDMGLFRYYLNSEPDFSFTDKKEMWKFIVEKLGSELLA